MNFLELLKTQTILADGAMGTMLHGRGIGFDKCFDELNLTNPAAVADIHREYIEAGAQLVITNTFGANRFKLAKHGMESRVVDINRAGVELAKRAVSASFNFCTGDGTSTAACRRISPRSVRTPNRPAPRCSSISNNAVFSRIPSWFGGANSVAPSIPKAV